MVVLNSGDDTALSEHLGTGVAAGARKAHHEGTQGTPPSHLTNPRVLSVGGRGNLTPPTLVAFKRMCVG